MSTEIPGTFFGMMLLILSTIVIVVVLVQVFSTYRARSNIMREEAYRKLSEQATTAEQTFAETQKRMADALEDMRARLTAIEKMLREVE